MNWALDSICIEGGDITIRTFNHDDIPSITEGIYDPEGWHAKYWGITDHSKIKEMLNRHIEAYQKLKCNPIAYFVGKEVAGITRYMNIDAANRALEIGGTWIAPKWKKTFVNTKVKYHLLKYVFEVLKGERVEFRVDAENYTSQMAVLRIGAAFEGNLRRRQIWPNGEVRDGHLYTVVKTDWPKVEEKLLFLQKRKTPLTDYLPFQLETERFKLRIYNLSDAEEYLALIARNRKSLIDSFPQSSQLQSVLESKAYITKRAHEAYTGKSFFYGVWDKTNNLQVGQFQIKYIDWELRSADFGYFIDAEYRRKGIATELLQMGISELSKRSFKRMQIRSLETNTASICLAKKLGFQYEGTQKNAFLTGNREAKNIVFYSNIEIT